MVHRSQPHHSGPEPVRIRSRNRGAWSAGLGISAVAHLVVLFLYHGVAGPPTVSVAPSGEGPSELQGLELLNLVAMPDEDPDRPRDPEQERIVVPVTPQDQGELAPVRDRRGGEGVVADEGPLGPSAAERLRVRAGDDRLWAPLAARDLGEVSMQQFLESDLAWRLGLWQDSAAMEAARQRRSLDWTYTDDQGGRWGISPEGIHLGSVTLPLPVFAPAYGAARERALIDQEVARGVNQGFIWETLEERADAMRRRRDAEREQEAKERAQAGPRRTRPDTTGVRRIP